MASPKDHYTRIARKALIRRVIFQLSEVYKQQNRQYLTEIERENMITLLQVNEGMSRRSSRETLDVCIEYINITK
jgi:hypothetical protein